MYVEFTEKQIQEFLDAVREGGKVASTHVYWELLENLEAVRKYGFKPKKEKIKND